MRRIILVDLYWTRDNDPRIPLGHASLLTTLRQESSVEVVPIVRPMNDPRTTTQTILAAILEGLEGFTDEDVDVAFGAYVWSEQLIQELLPALRMAGFRGRLILGGPQISYSEVGISALYPDADVFVRGYGESALLSLSRSADRPRIAGVVYSGDEDRGEQAQVRFEELPSPWLSGAIPLTNQSFIRWETQRGCPFRCSFCQHREAGSRLRWRALSERRVMTEVEAFCAAGVEDIAVLDPIFNLGPLSEAILESFVARDYRGRLSLQCRAESISEAFLRAASRLRTRLEFGLQTIHERESTVIERRNNMAKVDTTLGRVRGLGLAHEVSLIFGLPLQSVDSFIETVSWCLERRIPVIKAFPLMLLRGTELERTRERWGLRESQGTMPVVIASKSFTFNEWLEMARISEALKVTEGAHPSCVRKLLSIARTLEPVWARWRPLVLAS